MLYILAVGLNLAVYAVGIATLGDLIVTKVQALKEKKKPPEKEAEAETEEGEA